jgi:hypothetical protein
LKKVSYEAEKERHRRFQVGSESTDNLDLRSQVWPLELEYHVSMRHIEGIEIERTSGNKNKVDLTDRIFHLYDRYIHKKMGYNFEVERERAAVRSDYTSSGSIPYGL